jgi:UPF0271 protein
MAGLIELNADVGEGGPDEVLVPLVDRVSIACGGHAGDAASMRRALLLARQQGVLAGSHPGYPDPAHFGRRILPAQPQDITRWVREQTLALLGVASELGMRLFHVKPHGALYNRAAVDEPVGRAVVAALLELGDLSLIVLAGSPLAGVARAAGVPVLEEGFADRRYLASGELAPRHLPGALIQSPQAAAAQASAIARGEAFASIDGRTLLLQAQTLCLHGDDARAVERARAVAAALGRAPR